jgi:hypothetical protein
LSAPFLCSHYTLPLGLPQGKGVQIEGDHPVAVGRPTEMNQQVAGMLDVLVLGRQGGRPTQEPEMALDWEGAQESGSGSQVLVASSLSVNLAP